MSYPNIEAIASGTISGRFSEWPRVRPEAKAILAELERLKEEVETSAHLATERKNQLNEARAEVERLRARISDMEFSEGSTPLKTLGDAY